MVNHCPKANTETNTTRSETKAQTVLSEEMLITNSAYKSRSNIDNIMILEIVH